MKLYSELVMEANLTISRYAYCGRCYTECIDDSLSTGSLMCPICNDGYVMHRFLTMDELQELKRHEKT